MLGTNDQPFTDIEWFNAPDQGVTYRSGLTLYQEVLHQERWIGQSWSPVGRPRMQQTRGLALDEACPTPVHAFELEMDGQSLHYGWQWRGTEEHPHPREGVRHVSVVLEHRLRPVRVQLHTQVDGTACIMRWLEITNMGNRPAALGHVAPMAGLLWRVGSWRRMDYRDLIEPHQGTPFSVGFFGENNALEEGDFIWKPLADGVTQFVSRKGRSGHGLPFFILRHEGTGEHFIGHLGWSGNWQCQFTYAENRSAGDAALSFRIGPAAPSPARVLQPGETIVTPEVHLGYVCGDLDRSVQEMHAHLRRTVLSPQPEGRGQVVIGKGTGYMGLGREMSEERLKASIDVAAEVGCELYLIDAGWYTGSSKGWHETAGDWYAGEHLPNGLEPVFAYARQKGLLYGLWVEIERLGEKSSVYQEHPDWVLTRYGKPIERGPLDMTKPEVAQWMEAEIVRIVERYDLDLYRLDYNINVWEGGQTERDGFLENTQWRHYEALYAMFDRIRARFPHVLLENCASGGGRMDVGILSRFHTTWISDWMALPRSAKILNGVTLALPPEVCNRMTGASMFGDLYGDLETQLRLPLFGHYTLNDVAADLETLNPIAKDRVRYYTGLYKEFVRPMLATSRVYHHTPTIPSASASGWAVLEYCAADGSAGMAGLFRLAGQAEPVYHFQARGLDPSRQYEITFGNSRATSALSGLELMHRGLDIRVDNAVNSELLLFRAV